MHYINFDTVQNYYERLVFQQIVNELGETELGSTPGALEDIACLALNQLPPRYVRYAVDTSFYLSVDEQQEMVRAVELAVQRATKFVTEHPRGPLSEELPPGELPD